MNLLSSQFIIALINMLTWDSLESITTLILE